MKINVFCHQNKNGLKKFFCTKIFFFFNIFYSFNPNHAYWNQRWLFSGNLPGMFLVTLKQEMERKSEWFCGVNFFPLILKWSEKTVFEQKMAFSLVVFCSHAAILLRFLPFFSFLDRMFFQMVFPIDS